MKLTLIQTSKPYPEGKDSGDFHENFFQFFQKIFYQKILSFQESDKIIASLVDSNIKFC